MVRLFAVGWLFHLKGLTQSGFFVLIAVVQPVIFASIAFFMFESGSRAGTLLYVALGAGLMGIWSATLFGVPLEFVHPLQLAVALPVTVGSLGLLGLVLASTFVLYRNANAFANLLEYPIWLITGLLVPLSLLPGWVEPISWLLAPTWGIRAIRDAALVEAGSAWPEIGMCVLLGGVYLVLGSIFLRNFERLARRRATLSLT
jgi:hypothetical protein